MKRPTRLGSDPQKERRTVTAPPVLEGDRESTPPTLMVYLRRWLHEVCLGTPGPY